MHKELTDAAHAAYDPANSRRNAKKYPGQLFILNGNLEKQQRFVKFEMIDATTIGRKHHIRNRRWQKE